MERKAGDDADKIMRRILRDATLDRVDLIARPKLVMARAVPSPFHKAVSARREAYIASKSGSISLEEATQMGEDVLKPVGQALGGDMVSALLALETVLKGQG